jgi:rod shape-determining protein MreC
LNSLTTSVAQLIGPLKSAAQRFAYSALILLSIAVIVLGKADMALIERVRTATADVMAPILSAIARPVAAATAVVDRFGGIVDLYRENERLRAENADLMQWQEAARRLDSENQELRSLTNYRPEKAVWYITARVIGTEGGAFSRNLLIDRGRADGVAKGQAVTSGTGLVGRIAEVGERAARVLLLTDLNSRIPVTLEASHDRAILAGDNTERPWLAYAPPNARIAIGDQVVTSGDGGVFPPGLRVGAVASADGGRFRVEPSTELSRIEYLRIVDFGLSGVLPPDAVPQPKAPPHKAQGEAGQRP